MWIRILKFPVIALRAGQVQGHPAPRRPLAWLPLLLALPIAGASLLFLFLLFLLLLPLLAIAGGIAWLSLGRKRRAFAEQGVPFVKVEGRLPVLEAEIVRDGSREQGTLD